jgi:PIN domain nuclease of toxin-antitoxin system
MKLPVIIFRKKYFTKKLIIVLWIANILPRPYVKLAPLSGEIAIESCQLPGSFHPDLVDRMIVATSPIMDIPPYDA